MPPFARYLLLLLFSLPTWWTPAQAQAPGQGLLADSTELRVLHQFFLSTNGSQWYRHDNWPATDSAWARATLPQAATWYGVTTANGDVTGLYLSGIAVTGKLLPSIGQLTELRTLIIERNLYCCPDAKSLGGTLPKEIGQLRHLQTLSIQYTTLSGALPAELGNLSELQVLRLENNNLSGPLPPELGNLTQLRSLVLDNRYRESVFGYLNHFSGGIPVTLAHLPNLTELALGDSPLGGPLPAELGQLTQLQSLAVDDAGLTGAVPASVLALPNLTSLNLGMYNEGYAFPNAFTSLPGPGVIAQPATLNLRLSYNQFGFDQLEPYFTAPGQLLTGPGSTYLPQYQAPLAPDTTQVVAQATVTLDGTLPGTHNRYQWQRLVGGQWLALPDQTRPQLSWPQVTTAETGRYRALVTNTLVTGLTLSSRVHLLDVLPYPAKPRNLPDDTNAGLALLRPHAPADSATVKPVDMNYVRTWVPRVALRTTAPAPPVATLGRGLLLREQWSNAPGATLAELPLTSPPTSTSYVLALEGPTSYGNDYGARLRGYITAPQTGSYVFALASDDASELWLSTDSLPAHKQRRAYVLAYTDPHQYGQYPSQQSDPIALVAGQRYYVEVLHKQGQGGNHLSVAWTLPDGSFQDPVPGSVLTPFVPLAIARQGGVLREEWNSLPGYTYQLTDIPLTSPVNGLSYLTSLEKGTPVGDSYGDRIRGYLVPQVEGDYTFWIAGDHQCGLWVSPDSLPAHLPQNPTAIVSDHSDPRQWERVPGEQRSQQPLHLVAGQRYYVEVQHKEQGGNNTVAVAWQRAGGPFEGPIPGRYLAPYLGDYPARFGTALGPLAAIGSSWTVDSASISTQYLDGLGRPVQTVLHQASPQRKDLVQVQAYDGLGREPRAYLPYAADTAGTGRLGYHGQPLTQQQQFYQSSSLPNAPAPGDPTIGVVRSGAAYSDTQFEASPLNRVLAQGAPGEAWQLTQGHITERVERPNTAADSVLYFKPGYDPASLDPGYQGFYQPGELWGVQVSEPHRPDAPGEQGYASIEWKDKLGQVVGKQVEVARTGSVSAGLHSRWLRTAYVYDDFPRLRFVVQPEGTKRLLTPPAPPAAPTATALATRTLAQGLQVWLKLDEATGTVAADSSGQGRAATLSVGGGSASWLPTGGHDGLGGALQLRGGARLTVPLSWQPTRFSVSFWLLPSDLFNYGQQTGAGQGWGGFLFHSTYLGEIYVGTDVPSRLALLGQNAVTIRAWQHFVFTFDQGVATLYKNGQVLASRPDMNPSQPWQNFVLGMSGDEAYDEVRVYDRALSAAEVTALAQPLVPPTPASLVPPTPASLVADYLFHYRYDGRGRQIAKQVPGQAGETLVVYDQLDRPVLSQDAQQRVRREWSWSKYDALGRGVLTGLTTRQDTLGQVSLQNLATADTATAHQYEQRSADGARYPQYYTTGQAFPRLGQQGFGAGLVLTASYYDDYDFDNDGQANAHYSTISDGAFAAGLAPVADEARVTGLATHTLTRVLNRPAADPGVDWLQTTSFYDERGRVVQVQSVNARDSVDLVTMRLDFLGKPVQTVARHGGPSHAPVQVVETSTYDHAERLRTTTQQLPGEASPALLSLKHYNELGQLTVDSLATGRLAQAVKYAYNIRGWLTSLNNPYQPDPADLFNLSLHYEQGFSKGYEQYNGNLTGQTWRGRDGVQRAYGYVYDPLNRLLQGDYVARAGGSTGTLATATAWQAELDHYRLSFVSYDDNGNIQTLRRQGLLQAATHNRAQVFGAVDNLTYAYQGNRLQAVDDQVTGNQRAQPATYHGAPTSLAGDFQEGGAHQGQEYGYDANGNLTQDKNKGITGILYNYLNLPRQIHFGQVGDSVVFRYAASGQKVAKLVYQTGKPAQRTDYLGPYQYEQDSLRFFPHAEGRVLRFVQYDAAHQPTVSYQREFTVKDHLGNLRLAYRAGQVRRLLATLEQDDNTHKRETQQFDSLSVSQPIAVNTSVAHSGTFAARLNAGGSTPQPLGPLTQLGVQKGDTVTVQAFGYYAQPVQHDFLFSLGSFLANLFHPAQAPSPGLEASRRKDLPLVQVGVAAGLASIPQLSGGVPKGYLRVLVFNQDSALAPNQPAPVQLTQAANGGYERLSMQLVLPQDGYVTAYVGNESDVDVLFDDVSVEHRPGLQVQETQYDPAGLELTGLVAPSPGIKGLNNYRFNGKEFQQDLGLNWNHQDWRFLDPTILRWNGVDPEIENGQESWTPYSFGFDNAVRYADANGRVPGGGGPGQPQAQTDIVLSELEQFVQAVQESLPSAGQVAGAIGLTAAGAWVMNHLPSSAEMADAFRAGAADPTTTYRMGTAQPILHPETVRDGLRATDNNGRINASSSTRPARRVGDGPSKGRLGNKATRDQVKDIADKMEDKGYEITGGGGKRRDGRTIPEEHLAGPGGKAKGGSYPDITATKNGRTVRVNTVDTNSNGTPTTRETNNAARIRQQTPGDHLLLIPKN